MKIGIIGAGAAGILAALQAREQNGEVLLLDANPTIGRKLAASGSGRCNLTNTQIHPNRYHSASPKFLEIVFSQFGHKELIRWLEDHGILTYITEDGWGYPLSNSASNVVDILQAYLINAGVELHLQTMITDIKPIDNQFELITADKNQYFIVDRVIVASGGPAYPQLGARKNMYEIIEKFGHTLKPVKPALAPLLTDPRPFCKLQGVRLDAGVKLMADGKIVGETVGNIIFTSWGLNGPGVMNLSHLVSMNPKAQFELLLDFVPTQFGQLKELIEKEKNQHIPFFILLESVLPAKVAKLIIEQSGFQLDKPIEQLRSNDIEKLLFNLRNQKVVIHGAKGFKECQLSIGGVPLNEVDPQTMQSSLIKGLFFAGEILDVVGPCGGFNLQWAFSSGYVAGNHTSRN